MTRARSPTALAPWLVLPFAIAASCAGTRAGEPAPRHSTALRSATVAHHQSLPDRAWGVLEAPAQFLVAPLPDREAWRVERDTGSWLVLKHPPSDSELRMTSWLQDVVSNRDRCERDGRATRVGFPEFSPESIVEDRVLGAPEGFDTAVRAIVRRAPQGDLEGTVLAVGANVRRCIAILFVTHVTGLDAERIVAERLRLIIDGTLARMRSWKIENRARTEDLFLR